MFEHGNSDKVERLVEQLKSEDAHTRRYAANQLGKIKDEKASPALIEALRDEDWEVRKCAANALEKMNGTAVISPLIDALEDEDWDVRRRAANILERIGELPAVILIEKLKDEDGRIRGQVVELLAIAGEAAVPDLVDALRHGDEKVRRHAATALEKIVDKPRKYESFEKIERKIYNTAASWKDWDLAGIRMDAETTVARVLRKIGQKKNRYTSVRDLLLKDKPKPPRRKKKADQSKQLLLFGRPIFRQA